jgi:hypothetical protein
MKKPEWLKWLLVFPVAIPLLWPGSFILLVHWERTRPVHGIVTAHRFSPAHPVGMARAGDRWYLSIDLDRGGKDDIEVAEDDYDRHPVGARYDRD